MTLTPKELAGWFHVQSTNGVLADAVWATWYIQRGPWAFEWLDLNHVLTTLSSNWKGYVKLG